MTIRERVTVKEGGRIEILHPELPVGTEAEVIVLVEQPPARANERRPASVRESMHRYLAAPARRPPPGAGLFDSGHTSTAERSEEVLGESGFGEDAG
jgi:hypothetical protein